MTTSAPGSKAQTPLPQQRCGARSVLRRGFTLLELLVVLAIVALSVGAVSLALRDGTATALEREGVRLAALLEMARAESRVTGTLVRWVPGSAQGRKPGQAAEAASGGGDDFRFVGLSALQTLPTRWLDARVTDHGQHVARRAARRVVEDRDVAHRRPVDGWRRGTHLSHVHTSPSTG